LDGQEELARRFERQRAQLRAVAYRMLGSPTEADDAVQDAWLRLSRADVSGVDDLEAWLRTVVARLCLDALRSRQARREEPLAEPVPTGAPGADPEHEALLVDSVGRAMLVVLDRLAPAERVAFVLHDLFAVPFDQIAPIVDRNPAATKKLASRARLRVRGAAAAPRAELGRQRRVVEAILGVLAPDVVRRADLVALQPGGETVVRGGEAVARQTMVLGARARFAEPALVNGAVGAVIAPHGRLLAALAMTVRDDQVVAYDVIADPERLRQVDLAVL
jgi:RNA polymerase sigma factor (sigma-70 family)